MKHTAEIKNAIITGASLDIGDRGLLMSFIQVDYGGSGQGFGGYCLYRPRSFTHHKLNSVAGHWIFRCLEIAGADEWSKLIGKTIRVDCESSKIHGIGHIVKDDWFYPAEDFKEAE